LVCVCDPDPLDFDGRDYTPRVHGDLVRRKYKPPVRPLEPQVLRTSRYSPHVAHFTADGYTITACGMDVHTQRLFEDAYATDNLCPECVRVLAALL
jgi:hypothetical protein